MVVRHVHQSKNLERRSRLRALGPAGPRDLQPTGFVRRRSLRCVARRSGPGVIAMRGGKERLEAGIEIERISGKKTGREAVRVDLRRFGRCRRRRMVMRREGAGARIEVR